MNTLPDTMSHYDEALSCREAVGIFAEAKALKAAIDDLLINGFNRREISLLANDTAAQRKLRLARKRAEDLADDPSAQ